MDNYSLNHNCSRGDAALVLDKCIAYLNALRVVIPRVQTDDDGQLSCYGGMTASDKKELQSIIKALRVILNADFNNNFTK